MSSPVDILNHHDPSEADLGLQSLNAVPESPATASSHPTLVAQFDTQEIANFLSRYSFDHGEMKLPTQVAIWQQDFAPDWIPAAILEALFQGRYKLASIHQILLMWRRRGIPRLSFDHDFCLNVWPEQLSKIGGLRRHRWELAHVSTTAEAQFWPVEDPTISITTLCHQLQADGIPPRLYRLLQSQPIAPPQPPQEQSCINLTSEIGPEIFIDLGASPPHIFKGSLALEKIQSL
ncbi:MAG: hypothetical protein HC924_10985 [Synechococcaceae cyanobacterium SM2_3_2]|nr:hypothetical protein [Synechococcaceae cyanobacterium SM2_3_2]